MSLKSAPYYWLECDDCGEKSTESADYAAWAEVDGAIEDAECSDWYVREGYHWCYECRTKHVCVECDKPSLNLNEERACPDCRDGGPR